MALFLGAVVLAVVALLALDWFMAGRPGGRRMKAARDGEAGNPNPGYALIAQESVHREWKNSQP